MRVTLRQIESFLAAADELSFSRAALRLHVSQSAFSQQMREMETALGVRLFDRTTRKVALTASGNALLHKMRGGLAAIDDACRDAQAISRLERGHVSIGTLPSLAGGWLTQALSDLRRSHPAITVTLEEGHNPDLIGMVMQAKVEFAVCAQAAADTELLFEPLFAEEVVAVVPGSHALAGTSQMTWKSLHGQPLITMTRHSSTRNSVSRALLANDIEDSPAYEVGGLATALSMVRAGLGVALMPLTAVLVTNYEGLAICRLTDPIAIRRIAMCRRRDRLPSAAALDVAELVRARIRQKIHPGIATVIRSAP